MKLKFITISLFLSILICIGCEADYDIDKHFGADFLPRVVLNSVITPSQSIMANLYWSKYYADTADYKVVESFDAELYENDTLIAHLQCEDGLFAVDISPKESKTYRFKITVPNYGEVRASTTIPTAITSDVEYVKMVEVDSDNSINPYSFAHFKITEVSPVEEVRAVWIMTQVGYLLGGSNPSQNGARSFYLYSDSNFADKLNARRDLWCSEARGSSVRFNQYIRIKYADFSQAFPLDFSIEASGRFENERLRGSGKSENSDSADSKDSAQEDNLLITPLFTVVNVVTPSTDYDQYKESVFESYQLDPFGAGGSYVYSNVENGLGLFAGYSVSLYSIDLLYNQQ